MKKLICVLLCVAILASLLTAFAGCKKTPRDEILKIYMPGEYIDEEIFEEFEEWYLKETGKKITVQLDTFENVENVQLAVEGANSDYDLLCPSDYMIGYLRNKNLIKPINKKIIDITTEGLFLPEYLELTKQFDPDLEYSVPYMYGTLGILYDKSKTNKDITSWTALFGNEYVGHRSMKDSIHDAYAAACLYNNRAELLSLDGAAKTARVQAIFEDTTKPTRDAAQEALSNVIRNGAFWDNDNIKFSMATQKADENKNDDIYVALMWSCDAGYVMNDYEDVNGDNQPGNRNLWYVVPEEGGNIYIDSFVINTYTENEVAANYFLKFLCLKEIAVKNCEYAGCISPVTEAYNEMKSYYEDDEDGMFEGVSEEWRAMFIETMFPSAETIARCGMMKDFGADKSAVNEMWTKVKKAH